MSVRTIQNLLALVFFVLGSWCLVAPESVLELAITPQYRSDAPIVPILMAAFGAQAVIAGTFAAFTRFTRTTFVAYAAVLLPFFVFDYWFYFVEPMLTVVGLLDVVGNIVMLGLCYLGWRALGENVEATRQSGKMKWALAIGLGATIVATDMVGLPMVPSFVGQAEARIGQPWTALSGAGVARRTTRRVIRRSAIYVATLPPACVRTSIDGVVVWRCGATYYQPYRGRYVVVYVR